MNSSLKQLMDADFISRLLPIATSEAKYAFLLDQPEVKAVSSMAFLISFEEFTQFVHSIPSESGKSSFYDDTFSALAVALEPHYEHGRANTNVDFRRFTEDYLLGLASLDITELPMAPKIAKIVINNRRGSVN